jgi:glycogen operon protein
MSSSADGPIQTTDSLVNLAGVSYPVGATVSAGGVNFCVYSRNATGITLALFDQADDAAPSQSVRLDPETNRTYHYWHVFVPGLRAGQLYGYYADGPHQPTRAWSSTRRSCWSTPTRCAWPYPRATRARRR